MSEHVEGFNRDQTALFPETLEGYVDKENPVRFIDAFVDSLNLEKLGFKRVIPNDVGRPSYDPSDLLKLCVYGYLNQVRSSRKLERECYRNLEVIWLMKKLAPDHWTIASFRTENADCVKGVFKEFVKLCIGLGLYGAQLVAIDGVKLKAVNSLDKSYNRKMLARRLKVIEEQVSKYLSEMEEEDRKEEESNKQAQLLEEKVKKLLKNKDKYTEILAKLKESGQNEISLVDPDSRLMKNHGAVEPCYNSHVAVDAKNHLIVDYNVTNDAHDRSQLSPIAKQAKETLGVEKLDATADKGFFNGPEIKECVDNGISPYVPEQRRYGVFQVKKRGVPTREFAVDKFVYDKATDTFVCPAGNKLEFKRIDDSHGTRLKGYKSKTNACFACEFFMTKCTRDKAGRTVWRWEQAVVVDEMKDRNKREPEKLALRMKIVEHPFGTIKRDFNQGYLLLKGLKKVAGEVGFTMLAYNMRRFLNILGPEITRFY
jgi:transposase